MSDDLEDLDPLHEGSFLEGQEALAKKVSSQRFKEELKTLGEVGQAAAETLGQATQLAKEGDPHTQRLAALIKNRVVGVVEQAITGRPPAGEAREGNQPTPFFDGSSPPLTSLPDSTPKSLPPTLPESSKKKRGRPPKRAGG